MKVVVVGYGVQRKSDLTGAVASVNSKDLKGLATTDAAAAAALQGKAAGIQILNLHQVLRVAMLKSVYVVIPPIPEILVLS